MTVSPFNGYFGSAYPACKRTWSVYDYVDAPLDPVPQRTRDGLLEIARMLDPAALRWGI